MKTYIRILFFLFLWTIVITSCSDDVINTDPNYRKDLVNTNKPMTPDDSLKLLRINNLNFPVLPLDCGTMCIHDAIYNDSKNDTIIIYKITYNTHYHLFLYTFPTKKNDTTRFPYKLAPSEFYPIACYFNWDYLHGSSPGVGTYYDTLYINGNKNFKIVLKAEVKDI